MNLESGCNALLLLFAVLSLSSSPAALANCTLGVAASCSLNGTAPSCCQIGLACNAPNSTSGNCCITNNIGSFACSSNSQCCSGKCEAPACVPAWSCGYSCTTSNDCGSSCSLCAAPTGGGASTCRSCIPQGSTTSCSSSSQCCTGSKCDPSTSLCASCFGINVTCLEGSDCCSGRCEQPSSNESRKCSPALGLSYKGGPCSSDPDCQPSAPSLDALFCDLLNPNPANHTPGVCRSCVPDSFACDGSQPCCNPAYGCRTAPTMGPNSYCLNDPGGSAFYLPANWVKIGSGRMELSPKPRTGAQALFLDQNGDPNSYVYNSQMVLKNASKYLLEFWTWEGGSTGARYAIYDVNNDAYLSDTGEWVFSPLDANQKFEQPVIMNSVPDAGSYAHFVRNFTTLAYNVSYVQLRFYPGEGTTYLDDVSITEIHDFTMLAWIKEPALKASTVFYQLGTEEGENQGLDWYLDSNGNLTMRMDSSNLQGGASILPSVNVSGGNWHMAALSVDRTGNYTSYLDGSQVSSGAFTLWRLNNTEQFYIGSGAGGSYFQGEMDEVRFYQRALSQAEIHEHYKGRYQSSCSAAFSVSYNASNVPPKNLTTAYNAYLRIRSLPPEVLLSMPFDTNVSSDASGAITDYSRSLTAGTKGGARWVAEGKVGGAYNFSSSTDKIAVGVPVLSGNTDFTVSAWAFPYSVSGTRTVLGNAGASNPNGVSLTISSQRATINVAGGGVSSQSILPSGSWVHLAATRKSGNVTIYVNGIAEASATSNGSITSSLNSEIGNSPDPNTYFAGMIDEVRVYGKALTESEIRALYRDTLLLSNRTLVSSEG